MTRGYMDSLFLQFFSDRQYAKNTINKNITVGYYVTFSLLLSFAFLSFAYLPFKIFGMTCVVAFAISAGLMLIKHANELLQPALLNITFSLLALGFRWHWGFSVFSYHLESYFCYMLLGASCIALLRRGWNYLIWKKLDGFAMTKTDNSEKQSNERFNTDYFKQRFEETL